MTDTPDPTDKKLLPDYVPVHTVPFIHLDYVPTYGTLAGAVEIELATRILLPSDGGGVQTRMLETGRSRCSPTAAEFLKDALDAALKMLEQPASSPTEV